MLSDVHINNDMPQNLDLDPFNYFFFFKFYLKVFPQKKKKINSKQQL